jgi:hypothetical protein
MRAKLSLIFSALFIAGCLGEIPAAHADSADRFNSRFERQSERIDKGRGKRKMTPAEQTRHDEAEYRMENEMQRMRTKNGKLSVRDRRRLNRQLNRNSRGIRRDRHD